VRQRGFTLIEVMVALIVVALGIGALLVTLTSSAESMGYLRDKSLAQWIALNRISEVRLSGAKLATGVTHGTVDDYAGTSWSWEQEVSDPGMAGMLRIEVRVAQGVVSTSPENGAAGGKAPQRFPALATAFGFTGAKVAPPSGFDPDWSLASAESRRPDGADGAKAPATP
jgi:general secretion pathway protein I